MSPKPVCNHVSGEHYSAHMLVFMHAALHDKLIETALLILGPTHTMTLSCYADVRTKQSHFYMHTTV